MTPRVQLALERAGVVCSGDDERDAWGLAIRCRDERMPLQGERGGAALQLALALMRGRVDEAEAAADALLALEQPSLAALDAMVAPAAPTVIPPPSERCVHCRRLLLDHDAGVQCEWCRDRAALPAGASCARCVQLVTCAWLIGRDGSERSCDWSPSRFRLPLAAGEVRDAG